MLAVDWSQASGKQMIVLVLIALFFPFVLFALASIMGDLQQGLPIHWWRVLLMAVIAEALWIVPAWRSAKAKLAKRAANNGNSKGQSK